MSGNQTINPDAMYSPKSAGAFLGIHEESIRRFVRDRRIASIKIGRVIRIKGSDLIKIATGGMK